MKSLQLLLAGLLVGLTFIAATGEGYDPWYLFALAVTLAVLLLADQIIDTIFEDKRR